jgi:hypothetical protein
MTFRIFYAEQAQKEYDAIIATAKSAFDKRKANGTKKSSKCEGLAKQIKKTVDLLSQDPRHHGLATHKYDEIANPYFSKKPVFEAYAQNKTPGAYRVFWCYGPEKNDVTIIAITPHP